MVIDGKKIAEGILENLKKIGKAAGISGSFLCRRKRGIG